jgi:hypothetical protein
VKSMAASQMILCSSPFATFRRLSEEGLRKT